MSKLSISKPRQLREEYRMVWYYMDHLRSYLTAALNTGEAADELAAEAQELGLGY